MSETDLVKTLNLIDARVVQMEDIEETAAWCGGDVGIMFEGDNEGQHYIQIDDVRAVTGEWIGQTKIGFVMLSDEEYRQTFHAAAKHRDRFAKVLKLVQAAMADGFSDIQRGGGKQSMIAESAALRIMEIVEPNRGV